MAYDGVELREGGVEAEVVMVGLAADGHATASLDDSQRKQETQYKQAARLARVILKADMVCQRAILLARCRVRRMVWALE